MRDFTENEVLEAIQDSRAIVSAVASALNCTWETANNYINKWESTKTAFKNERKGMLDRAATNVFNSIDEGSLDSSKWYLAHEAHMEMKREAINITIKTEKPTGLEELSPEKLLQILQILDSEQKDNKTE